MKKPDLSRVSEDVVAYIKHLESVLNDKNDPFLAMYYSLKGKFLELSTVIQNYELELDSKDKTFERFWTVQKDLKIISENLDWLERKVGKSKDDKKEKEKTVAVNLIEQRVRSRR